MVKKRALNGNFRVFQILAKNGIFAYDAILTLKKCFILDFNTVKRLIEANRGFISTAIFLDRNKAQN